ncbi:hypothetical protein SR882_10315 [Guyparkeria halophila]|uniref:Uncharacterized protein n=1 Tax=Guyparkeria halophila TaxID=47960 RepID=A0ABZ0YXL3_9GAMM|nr:hypothetical protein [Guyparkeria halophila]WQH16144.1 hypothetical protein SR882_10315 [Guyparkeria halophila]
MAFRVHRTRSRPIANWWFFAVFFAVVGFWFAWTFVPDALLLEFAGVAMFGGPAMFAGSLAMFGALAFRAKAVSDASDQADYQIMSRRHMALDKMRGRASILVRLSAAIGFWCLILPSIIGFIENPFAEKMLAASLGGAAALFLHFVFSASYWLQALGEREHRLMEQKRRKEQRLQTIKELEPFRKNQRSGPAQHEEVLEGHVVPNGNHHRPHPS